LLLDSGINKNIYIFPITTSPFGETMKSIFIFILLLAFATSVIAEDCPTTIISGHIYGGENLPAPPVPGAQVEVTCNNQVKSDITDENGFYNVEFLDEENCDIGETVMVCVGETCTENLVSMCVMNINLLINIPNPGECGGDIPCQCGDTVMSSYVMTTDLVDCPGDGLIIGANDVVLNCDGHDVIGDGSASWDDMTYGVVINGKTHVTIEQCTVSHFLHGIYLTGWSNFAIVQESDISENVAYGILDAQGQFGTFEGNELHDNGRDGIYLANPSWRSIIRSNRAYNNGDFNNERWAGIHTLSINNVIENNEVFGQNYGIWLYYSSKNNTITNNSAYENNYGIKTDTLASNTRIQGNTVTNNFVSGIFLTSSENNVFSNTIIGNPVFDSGTNLWVGNYWDDFEQNAGYPWRYLFTTGIDETPQGECVDADGDGYSSVENPICPHNPSLDCNDADPQIYPERSEICGNGIDDNCNGQSNEGCSHGASPLFRKLPATVAMMNDMN
jgi:parallel beta-helix repeat protein